MASATILVVEDEKPIREMVTTSLTQEGFTVYTAADGDQGLAMARAIQPDLVVLDLMLPKMDGIELCRQVLRELDSCVLMLTARSDEIDRIIGLSVGADDYLGKPFSLRELSLRIKAILRRSRKTQSKPENKSALDFIGLSIDPSRREVRNQKELIALTTREFDLLYTLAQSAGLVLTRNQLLDRVWGFDFNGNDRVVDVHVGFLRRKLQDDPADPQLIQTIRGVGYKFIAIPE
ncbi:MAG: winged helix-turn-helix domain-containing protein [Ardenticatenaceae bacterium]